MPRCPQMRAQRSGSATASFDFRWVWKIQPTCNGISSAVSSALTLACCPGVHRGTLAPMRLGLSLGLVVVCGLGAFACKSESDPPVYLDAEYQLRCLDCTPATADSPEHEIQLLDGEFDWRVECDVRSIGGRPTLTVNAQYLPGRESDEYGFKFTRVAIGEDEEQTDVCTIAVTEADNTYEAGCTSGDPTGDKRCQVSFERKDEIVEGTVYCNKIPNPRFLQTYRYLVGPGSMTRGAKIAVHNCEGL